MLDSALSKIKQKTHRMCTIETNFRRCKITFMIKGVEGTFVINMSHRFRPLALLTLRMKAGNDSAIKEHLAKEMKHYKVQIFHY